MVVQFTKHRWWIVLNFQQYYFSSASREQNRLEREQRAKQYYEQQLRERKKKLLEHRLKEERRRAAVEEKRRQRLKEEKVSIDFEHFLVRGIHSLGYHSFNVEAHCPVLRSDMNQCCVKHWRRAKEPIRTKTQEEGSSPKIVRQNKCAIFLSFQHVLIHITIFLTVSILCTTQQFLECLIFCFCYP